MPLAHGQAGKLLECLTGLACSLRMLSFWFISEVTVCGAAGTVLCALAALAVARMQGGASKRPVQPSLRGVSGVTCFGT